MVTAVHRSGLIVCCRIGRGGTATSVRWQKETQDGTCQLLKMLCPWQTAEPQRKKRQKSWIACAHRREPQTDLEADAQKRIRTHTQTHLFVNVKSASQSRHEGEESSSIQPTPPPPLTTPPPIEPPRGRLALPSKTVPPARALLEPA